MSGARLRALLVGLAGAAVLAAAAVGLSRREPAAPAPRPAAGQPALLLLTSLPLIFGEDFSLQGGGSPALTALQQRYRIIPISVTDRAELAKARLLLMAQPLAQPAEDLVALDAWMRAGGRLLLLADPMLDWPSNQPLGDPLRPPAMFMDTGLLGHWGLRLDAPDQRGPTAAKLGGFEVLTSSPGRLSGNCALADDRLVAHCRIGAGRATIVADADFLDVEHLDGPAGHNFDALLVELAELER